jgi:DNA-binding transcriptional MerR regulator
MMNISQFSARTGLAPSALRYYESEGLLEPAERQSNGYRRYSELQIPIGKLINSLRQAGVSMAEIARFLRSPQSDKAEFLARWRREAEARLLSIQVARSYLQGVQDHSPPFHLLRWEKPLPMLWLRQWLAPRREESLPDPNWRARSPASG